MSGPLKVGDIRTRIRDGLLVEVVAVDGAAVRVVPYAVMQGHKRQSREAIEHPGRGVSVPASDFRDVVESDLRGGSATQETPAPEVPMRDVQPR